MNEPNYSTRLIKITTAAVAKHQSATIDDALLQAIFNGIDANASKISLVALTRNDECLKLDDEMSTLSAIKIIDNGEGIPFPKLDLYFQQFEQSWKSTAKIVGRAPYHGSKGCGRFKCFALGQELEWYTVYKDASGVLMEYTMKLDVKAAKKLMVVPKPVRSKRKTTGTELRISGLTNKFCKQFLSMDELRFDVLTGLLLDIELRSIHVDFFGTKLDPAPLKAGETTIDFTYEDSDKSQVAGTARVLAWKNDAQFVSHKHAFYYKPNGQFVTKRPSHVYADTHFPAHTLIITTSAFEKYSDVEADFLVFDKVDQAIRSKLLEFLTRVKDAEFGEVLAQIFNSNDYPYKNPPKSPLDELKMTAYNAVLGALVFENSGIIAPRRKALQVVFPLLNRLLNGDVILGDNIDKVLALNGDVAKGFGRMVTRMRLEKIIDRYNRLIHRRDFLDSLDKMVHVHAYSDILHERTQLHKIVAEEAWIFGAEYEQYNLVTSDKSILTLLRENVKRKDLFLDVETDDKHLCDVEKFIQGHKDDIDLCLKKIPDLVFARPVKMQGANVIEYLLVELKRPTVKIDFECRRQALEVFSGINNARNGGGVKIDETHRWRYCLVSSGMDDQLRSEFGKNKHLEEKVDGNYVIDVWMWDDIIEKARERLSKELDGLEIEANNLECRKLLAEYKKRFGVSNKARK